MLLFLEREEKYTENCLFDVEHTRIVAPVITYENNIRAGMPNGGASYLKRRHEQDAIYDAIRLRHVASFSSPPVVAA